MPKTKKQTQPPLNERERYVLDRLASRPDGFPSSELIDLTSLAFGCDARSVRRTLFSLREDRKLARYSGETKGRLWFAMGSPPSDVRPSTDHAIALLTLRQLAQRHLPAGVIGALADDFAGATYVLGAHPTDSNLAAARQWLGKTARLNAGHPLIAPDIDEALFQTIGRALYDDHTLDIHYKSYKESAPGRYVTRKHRVLPYALIEKGPLWYLVAKIKGKTDNTALRLDRIQSAAPVGIDMLRDKQFSLEHYLRQDKRMEFLAQPQVEVVLRVRESNHEHAFRSLKLADDQTIEDELGGFLLRATVAPSVPFRNLLMEKSASVEVVSPPALREEILNELRLALSQYR